MNADSLKKLCHRCKWAWDHPFAGEIGENGRWEISLRFTDDAEPDSYAGYVALIPMEHGQWTMLILLEDEDEDFGPIYPTLAEAKHALDLLLGADNPEIPADRDSADPWLGDEELHRQILSGMMNAPEFARELRAEVEADLKKAPRKSPFDGQ
jgi:hypothetical protein